MRVCQAHKEKAVMTLKNLRDDAEYDFCPTCAEVFELISSGAFFTDEKPDEKPKRGRPPKGGE